MDNWPRNDFIQHALSVGSSETIAIAAWKQANRVQVRGLPPILSLNHLAKHTDVSYQYLRAIVCRSVDVYRQFRVRKRSGGTRQICVPDLGLARVQTWIDRHVLSRLTTHPCSTAFAKGTSILKCAQQHAGCRWLIKCDVEQFFESISEIQVYRIFLEAGYVPLVAFELARICTRRFKSSARYKLRRWQGRVYDKILSYYDPFLGHLPQGVPTSPKLSNLAMKKFDTQLASLASSSNLIYTRYADDIVFSNHDGKFSRQLAAKVLDNVFSAMRSIGLSPNISKTTIVPPGSRKVVLGLIVNDNVPRLSKEFKNRLRIHVHYIKRFGILKHSKARGFDSVVGFREHLKGLLRYSKHVEPKFAGNLLAKLDKSDWKD